MRSLRASKAALALAFLVMATCFVSPYRATVHAEEAFVTTARAAVVIEGSKVHFEKNADEKLPIASTTKILTTITVLETYADIYETVTVPDAAVGVEGSSVYLEHGEKLTVRDLLYGLMLRSGNDCAEALAIVVSGSVKSFVSLMNAVAERAGASDSCFANPHGLPAENNYSTARDLAMITLYAMRNDIFREIVGTRRYTCPYAGRDYDRVMVNKNKMLGMIEGGNGVKTGYTKAAGRCLVSSAKRGDREIICVVLDCGPMFEESAAMIENAFSRSPECPSID